VIQLLQFVLGSCFVDVGNGQDELAFKVIGREQIYSPLLYLQNYSHCKALLMLPTRYHHHNHAVAAEFC